MAYGLLQENDIFHQLREQVPRIYRIGDSLIPRTVEEAILEELVSFRSFQSLEITGMALCEDKIKENKTHILLVEMYFML